MNRPAVLFALTSICIAGETYALPPSSASSEPQKHQFSQMDSDNNGYLTFEEFSMWHLHWLEWRFQRMDTDNDGLLSETELRTKGRPGRNEQSVHDKVRTESPLK